MSRKSSLSLAAALGLTALAATAFAQQFRNDQQPARLARDPARTSTPSPRRTSPPAASRSRARAARMAPPREYVCRSRPTSWCANSGRPETDDEKEKLKAKIADVLDKQFDQRQRRHESEIEALEAQVKRLKELVRLRNERRQEIVAKRLEQVLRDAEGLGW